MIAIFLVQSRIFCLGNDFVRCIVKHRFEHSFWPKLTKDIQCIQLTRSEHQRTSGQIHHDGLMVVSETEGAASIVHSENIWCQHNVV